MSSLDQRDIAPWEARGEGKLLGPSLAGHNIPSAPRASHNKVLPITNIFRGFKSFVETARDEDKRFRKDLGLIEAIKVSTRVAAVVETLMSGKRRQAVPCALGGVHPHILIASGDADTRIFPIPPKFYGEPERWTASLLIAKFGRTEHASGKVWRGPKIVLRKEWVEDCLRAGSTLGEHDYECKMGGIGGKGGGWGSQRGLDGSVGVCLDFEAIVPNGPADARCTPEGRYRGPSTGDVWKRGETLADDTRLRHRHRSASLPAHRSRYAASPVFSQRAEHAAQGLELAGDHRAARLKSDGYDYHGASIHGQPHSSASLSQSDLPHDPRPVPLHRTTDHSLVDAQHKGALNGQLQASSHVLVPLGVHGQPVPAATPNAPSAPAPAGIFTNSIGLPLSFHILCPTSLRNTLHVLIKTLGKGEIVALQEATIIVLACTPTSMADLDSAIVQLVQTELAGKRSRVAVSHEWIDKCCGAEQLVSMDGYRLSLDMMAPPSVPTSSVAPGGLSIGTTALPYHLPPTPSSTHGIVGATPSRQAVDDHVPVQVQDPRYARLNGIISRGHAHASTNNEGRSSISATAPPFVHPGRLGLVPRSPEVTYASISDPSHLAGNTSPRTSKAYQYLQSRSDPLARPCSRSTSIESPHATPVSGRINVDEYLARSHGVTIGRQAESGEPEHKRPRLSDIEQNAASLDHGSVVGDLDKARGAVYASMASMPRVRQKQEEQERQRSLSAAISESLEEGQVTDHAASEKQLNSLFQRP